MSTFRGADPVVARQRAGATSGLDVQLQEGPTRGEHTDEVIGFTAIGNR